MQVPLASSITTAETRTERYVRVRRQTEDICKPLATEDYVIQSMEDVSPSKWHLAHTTWFFETFVLGEYKSDYVPLNEDYAFLFNSYYVQAGERFSRPHRGLLSRPTVSEVYDYRAHVDENMLLLLDSGGISPETARVIDIGLNHEQQHQELLVTDLKHVFSVNPLYPAYSSEPVTPRPEATEQTFLDRDETLVTIGHRDEGFHYDNEAPPHRQFLEPYSLANRPVTNREYAEFVNDGGYSNPLLWLSQGWARVQEEGWKTPLYWIEEDGGFAEFTLFGKLHLDPESPVTHVSYFEADAYARWYGARLPTEFEWENVAAECRAIGHFSDELNFHPTLCEPNAEGFISIYGSSWEWTSSHYSPYPGYQVEEGALGEYNGKFMANQFVLRGGSCATPSDHIRATYRNFFPSDARWQFAGIRLAKS